MILPLANFGSFMGVDGLIIVMLALIFFGAKKLPELARGLGQSLNEFKKAREEFEGEFKSATQDVTPRGAINRQPYGQEAPVAPAPALAYHGADSSAASASEQALQQQVAELQQKLRAIETQKQGETTPAS